MYANHSGNVRCRCRIGTFLLAGFLAGGGGQSALAQDESVSQVKSEDASQAEITAGELLALIEHDGQNVEQFDGSIQFVRTFSIEGDIQERRGRVFFGKGRGARIRDQEERADAYAVRFHELRVGDRVEPEFKAYAFDGQWVVEKLPEERMFRKVQLAPPWEQFDPLADGQRPLLIPMGVKKDQVLARFVATELPATEGLDEKLQPYAEKARHLKLVPKPGYQDEDGYEEIHLWVRPDEQGQMLPWIVWAVDSVGDESFVRIIGLRVNEQAQIPDDVFDMSTPGEGWDVQISPMKVLEDADQ